MIDPAGKTPAGSLYWPMCNYSAHVGYQRCVYLRPRRRQCVKQPEKGISNDCKQCRNNDDNDKASEYVCLCAADLLVLAALIVFLHVITSV